MTRRLEDIGFYTLSDARARNASATSRLSRCELLLTGRCNFRCPYCRRVGGADISFESAIRTIKLWADDGLRAIRFSGGEPTVHPDLDELVLYARNCGIPRIAISTNGSAPYRTFLDLLRDGVNDFSISLDACCAADGDRMAGAGIGVFDHVVENIRRLAQLTYVTVGIVLSPDNQESAEATIRLAASLDVSDIRVIPAAQHGAMLPTLCVDGALLRKYPILRYRVANLSLERSVRGIAPGGPSRCGLVLDDMAVMGDAHYPCIIYLREGGAPIGSVGPDMRAERERWWLNHDCHADPICSRNCLDVCVDYNTQHAARGTS